jgi:subtilisin family serine protease
MNKSLLTIARRILLLTAFLLCGTAGWSQVYQNGVRKGMVKVKFNSSMTRSLSEMTVHAKKSGLTTGMPGFDAVAKTTKATNLERLFPYDPKFESKLRRHGLHLWYVVEIDENVDPKSAAAQFRQLKDIAYAEVEREKTISPYTVTPYTSNASTKAVLPFNDPLLKDQWHYDNTGQMGFSGADANVFEAWTTTTGANNIIVSVHDEGVDVKHADLKANIWTNLAELNGTPTVDDDGNGYVDDVNGYNFEKNKGAVDAQYHGTHVAGTIAAVNNNGIGVSGVAGGNGSGNGVKVMSLQIMGGAAIERSYVYAANNGAVISQNSWGYTSPGFFDQSVLDAIDYFVAEAGDYAGSPMKGGIVIFAAGNSNADASWYPGYHARTFSVSSVGPEGKKASYSNYGAWVEISAPGGDQDTYGSKGGVLSTIPNDQYAYLQGTSMACPHVSGIAALALANRTKQLTAQELWNKLYTGVTDVEQENPDFMGMLGTGSIDAALAIQNDSGTAPLAVADLAVTGIAQEFATLTWTVPSDTDDGQPVSFQLYHHTQAITPGNLTSAVKTTIKNTLAAGTEFSYELDSLLGLTTYHFAVTSTDRWGNVSLLSNVVSETTNQGPSIAVDENSQSISLTIDASGSPVATHDITIFNQAAGILRWNHFMRHTSTSLSFNATSLNYPKVTRTKTEGKVLMQRVNQGLPGGRLRSNDPVTLAFQSVEKTYATWVTNIIGETDLDLPNSAGAKFYVSEPSGFNLTQVRMYLKHDPALGPVIVEVYKGATPVKSNLVYAQEHSNWSADETWAYITLDEQLYFESASSFCVVIHVPAGNLFPLGIGYEDDPSYSTNCFMSFDLGGSWTPLETAINSEDFAWAISADSYNEHLGTYLTLEPGSGDVAGNEQGATTLTANASTLINGNYRANLVIASNDAQQQELRIPVNLTVSGHKPRIRHIDIADYGSVFKGTEKELEFVLENTGYGNFNDPVFSISNPQFSIVGSAPWQIKAREEVTLKVKFLPTALGNVNGTLTITNGDQSYEISLFGLGAETSHITLAPENQTINNVAIGDVVNAQVTVENAGAYPLKYFIPGYDTKGISDNWPVDYHTYGYKLRTSHASEANPIAYEFQNIASTGVDITNSLRDDGVYYTLDMGFEFPYYGENMSVIYIAQKGFTAFENSVRPINSPSFPGNEYSPRGIISPIGTFLSYIAQGKIFYQVEADRVIIQYDNVTDVYSGSITAQMVLHSNGDIRFYYEDMGFPVNNQGSLNIFIEDMNHDDGVLIHEWNQPAELYSGLALGFDYPGPDIITHVENASGILAPGASAVVDIELSTASLTEGTINRYINFISNDPANAQKSALVQLEITSGGLPQPLVSADTVAFGNVFQGATRSSTFTIKNPGTANVGILSMNFVNSSFSLTGESTTTVKPGLFKNYSIQIPTASLADLEDWLSINYVDGTHDTIYVTGKVVVPPAIDVDLSLVQQTLAYGEQAAHSLEIENTGLAPLEVAAVGKQWLSFEAPATAVSATYVYEKFNSGEVYQWIDIRKTGTQLPFVDFDNYDNTFWRTLELPFPIEFYGQQYTSFKIGDNGIISFEDDPEASLFTDGIPSQMHTGPCIMPYWTFSGFSDYLYPIEDIGIFYKAYDDKFIITFSYFTNNFGGMGDPVSAQVIFYKNGTMKFQYKAEEGGADATSNFSAVGLQKDSQTALVISAYQALDHGSGLAYVIVPAKTYVIEPGATLAGEIKINASNMYGGQYNETLKIQTNVPGREHLEKPIELTVTGAAVLSVPEVVDFESKMIAFEFGSPVMNYIDMNISNDGSASLDITWAQMTEGMQGLSLQIWALVDGWFGPEWRWADIAELYSPWAWTTPTFTIKPGDKLQARASFAPESSGDFTDELVFTTSLGERTVTLLGTGFEPPVMHVAADSIIVQLNTKTETATRTIAFNNLNGASDLTYEVSIDYGRATPAATETMATSSSGALLKTEIASVRSNTGARAAASYNRTLNHTGKSTPDTYVGTGGSAPFTLATKYNAGPEGFTISHVETFFKKEALAQGTVQVEIRAGGATLADAMLLTEGELDFTGSGSDNIGEWHAVTLDHPAGIYPNEDFYVIITYPLGIALPQGTINDEQTIPGRYYYFNEGLWYNMQEVSGFETFGWLMFAAEETAGNSSWLSITSGLAGTVTAGGESQVALLIEGAFSTPGDQVANIVIKSNDPNNASVSIPVKLHMNAAPQFNNVPEGLIMGEKETLTVTLGVADAEGNTFTVAPAQPYPNVAHSFANGTLTIVMTPDYGDAGNYAYTFKATDQYNAEREITLLVEVLHTNQAPEFIGTHEMTFRATGTLEEYAIDEFFSDPDGDAFTFTVTSSKTNAVTVFASQDQFLIRPVAIDEAELFFAVTDSYGAVTYDTITVRVDVVLGAEQGFINNGLGVYPNPAEDVTNITFSYDWTGLVELEIIDASGKQHFTKQLDTHTQHEIQLNVSALKPGFYILKASSNGKDAAIKLIKK